MSDTTLDKLIDADVRVERMMWVPSIAASQDAYCEDFRDFCEDLPESRGHVLYKQVPALAIFADQDPEPYEVADALAGVNGFLVQAASPCRRYHDDGSWSSSWGHYYKSWIHVSSEAEIADALVAKANEWAEKDKAKALARPLS